MKFIMTGYQDQWTRMHDKTRGSNNGWMYTAETMHVAPELIGKNLILDAFELCCVSVAKFQINRNPNQVTPPFSRDEVMGLLSTMKKIYPDAARTLYEALKANHWNFCNFKYYVKKPLSLNKIITAADILYTIKDEHRNTVWQERHTDAYCLAFRLPPSDIYYLKKMFGDKPNILETVAFYAETVQHAYGGEKSPRMITWLKIKDLGLERTILGRKVIATEKERFATYFGIDHPLTEKISS